MKYIVIGRHSCGWCVRSKQLLEYLKKSFKFIDLDIISNKENNKYNKYIPNSYSFIPKILIIEKNKTPKFIGGYDNLIKYLD